MGKKNAKTSRFCDLCDNHLLKQITENGNHLRKTCNMLQQVLKKGHDRESNTGLEGHSLSRYHYAIMAT